MTFGEVGRDRDEVDDIIDAWAVQRPDLDVSALQVFGHQERAYIRYHAALNHLFDRFNINVAAFDVLAALRRCGPPFRMTAGQLAKSSLITTGGVTMRVDRLVQAGLVVRERDQDDRRIVYSRLTPEGVDLVDRVADTHFPWMQRLLHRLSVKERAELARLLSKLETSIDSTESGGTGSENTESSARTAV